MSESEASSPAGGAFRGLCGLGWPSVPGAGCTSGNVKGTPGAGSEPGHLRLRWQRAESRASGFWGREVTRTRAGSPSVTYLQHHLEHPLGAGSALASGSGEPGSADAGWMGTCSESGGSSWSIAPRPWERPQPALTRVPM